MGQLIPFPIRARVPVQRARRVFRPQRDMERAMRQAHLMLAGAVLATGIVMLGMQLLLLSR